MSMSGGIGLDASSKPDPDNINTVRRGTTTESASTNRPDSRFKEEVEKKIEQAPSDENAAEYSADTDDEGEDS